MKIFRGGWYDTSKGDGNGRYHIFFSMLKYNRFTTPGAGPFWSLDKKFPLAKFHIEFCIISLWVSHIYREKERGWEYSQNDTNHIRLGHRKAEEKTKEKTVESVERIDRFNSNPAGY